MNSRVDYLCTFHYHGWEFDMPLRIDSPDMEQKELIFDIITLSLESVCKEVSFTNFSPEEAQKILTTDMKKELSFHFLNFYTPIWEPINFKKGVMLYKKNLIADENGSMYQRIGKHSFQAAVKKEGKALKLSDIDLEIDVVIPDKILAIIASDVDMLAEKKHKLILDHDEFDKRPGVPYLAKFDPLPSSALYSRPPDIYLDDKKNAYPYQEYRKGSGSKFPEKVVEYLRENGFSMHDKAVPREGREGFRYLLLERYENLTGQISQNY